MMGSPEAEAASVSYHRSRRPKRSTFSLTLRTILISAAASLVIAVGLALQMAEGADPALRGDAQAASDRRGKVVKTTVIRRVVSSGDGTVSTGSPAPTVSSAPVVSAPAPATSSTS